MPIVIVVDAGVLTTALTSGSDGGVAARRRLAGSTLAAPCLIHVEVLSSLRGLARAQKIDAATADRAVSALAQFPVTLTPHTVLLPRCWQLRHNLTSYDASYVALAETLGVTLLTTDRRIADAPGITCPVEVLSAV